MVRDETAIYIHVAPEFGGGKLGPFPDMEVRFGSDKGRVHVHVPEDFGVAKEHAKIIRQMEGSLILSPVERTAAVFVWKGDARRPTQVLTPTAIRHGDSFALVNAEGPKFIVELGKMPVDPRKGTDTRSMMRKRFTVAGFFAEVQRVIMATLYTFSPVAMAARAKMLWESGYIFTPRFIVSALLLLSGYLMMAPTGCYALRSRSLLGKSDETLKNCRAQLDALGGVAGTDAMDLPPRKLIGSIMTDTRLLALLEKDSDFYAKVKGRARNLIGNSSEYEWLYKENSSEAVAFGRWREAVAKTEGLDNSTQKLVPYLAAIPNLGNGDFGPVLDSQEEYVCGRGPLRLTWRQAKALGMDAALDAYVTGDLSPTQDELKRSDLLKKTATTAQNPGILGDPAVLLPSEAKDLLAGQSSCVVELAGDDREDIPALKKMLADQLGTNAGGLPDGENSIGAGPARIARYFAADVPLIHFGGGLGTQINFNKPTLSDALDGVPKSSWMLDRTAEVVARAVVLPCVAALTPKDQHPRLEKVFGTLPNPVMCLVLNYKLANE